MIHKEMEIIEEHVGFYLARVATSTSIWGVIEVIRGIHEERQSKEYE